MPNLIEVKGIEILKDYLKKQNRVFEESDNKTFDLIVDSKYTEVKTKNNPYKKFDFYLLPINNMKK
jgi:hypothetical protein